MTELIKLENVAIGYEQDPFVDFINLSIEKNQFWGVLGPNGSGKTTLLKTILNLISPVSGTVFFHNELVFGYVPQNEKFDPIFPISVCEMVSMGRYSRVKPGRRLSNIDNEIVMRSMDSAGISHLKDRTFSSLSGGEKQRTLLARAIAGEPNILVLDEPTASVDIKGEAQIMELVRNIQTESKLAVLMVSHFLKTVSEFSDHLILIDKDSNTFLSGTKIEVLQKESLDKFFGLNLNLD
ncbi:MAG: metal ABC transporter ATP-binding protein [Thermodesulfobacteriales bacterium]|nr:MAG: metal ABC transporter ATP-binding protein [Thermodesulfobacteriales bacterium]